MDLMIENGDYVPDGKGGLKVAEGAEAMLQRVLYRLSVPLGSFLPLPEFGSKLPFLSREKASSWEALASLYVRQALAEESEVSLVGVEISPVEDGQASLVVYLEYQGETVSFSTLLT